MFIDVKKEFREWLITDKSLSPKVASDIISRCQKLDQCILESIDLSISSPQIYLLALQKITSYSEEKRSKFQLKSSSSASLISAMKKYGEFIAPPNFDLYPNGYNIRGYKK